jgi:hypothetical protein
MIDYHYERADDGSVRHTAMAAVLLIVAGLGLMIWDNNQPPAAPAPVLQSP